MSVDTSKECVADHKPVLIDISINLDPADRDAKASRERETFAP